LLLINRYIYAVSCPIRLVSFAFWGTLPFTFSHRPVRQQQLVEEVAADDENEN
jgi:hypothetical protein